VADTHELSSQVSQILRDADAIEEEQAARGKAEKTTDDPTSRSDTGEVLRQTLGGEEITENLRSKLRPDFRLILPEDQTATMDVMALVKEGFADVGIRRNGEGLWELVYVPQLAISQRGHEAIFSRFKLVNDEFLMELMARQRPPAQLPAATANVEIKLPGTGPMVSIGALIPLMLILMTITGAVYPAIDLTAGERERGTLETLMAAPLPRMEILTAKYVAVVAVAMLTGAVNLLAMFVTLSSSGLATALLGDEGVSLGLIMRLAGMLALFAGFFSAALLAITSHARSFKEAQAAIIPLMIVSLAPGVASLLPQINLSPAMACVPVLNLVLATRDVFSATIDWSLLAITIATTAIYTGACLAFAARSFGSDALLGVTQSSWLELFQRPGKRELGEVATVPPVAGWFALMGVTPLFVVISGMAGNLGDWSLEARLLVNSLVTFSLFAGVPLAMTLWNRWPIRESLGMKSPKVLALALAAIAGLSLWMVLLQAETSLMSDSRKDELMKLFGSLQIKIKELPLAVKLIALAIVPAVCEEIFFRGLLFTAWRRSLGAWPTILLTGLVFGLFHILVRDSVVLERFIPTALLGILLGGIRERTGSLWPGMLMHVLNNATVLIFGQYAESLTSWGFDANEIKSLPPAWWISALVVSSGALALLFSLGRSVESESRKNSSM
jgi:membrane protease YdiL (CAAX protease family)/ABC-type transport system involved in multi-copper enzyme maturation permease subunit